MGEETTPTDEELVRGGLRGDSAALDRLFSRHAERLRRRIAIRLSMGVRVQASVADVLQDVFASAWGSLHLFEDRGAGSFKAWINVIAHHRVSDILRQYYRHNGVFRPSAVLPSSLLGIAQQSTPSQVAEAAELRAQLKLGVSKLPKGQRDAMRLVIRKGMSHKDAAKELGITESALEMRVRRGRKFLWDFIQRSFGGEE